MPDYIVTDAGSVVQFFPQTQPAREFAEEQLALESWQWFGDSFVVDSRYAPMIVSLMENDGLEVSAS